MIGTDPLNRPIFENEIYDPNTTRLANGQSVRDPFPNNQIPVNRFDPVAVKIQNLIPLPMGPNANGLTLNYLPSFRSSRVTGIPAVKIDQNFGIKTKVSAYISRTSTESPISPGLGQADGLPGPITVALGTFTYANTYRLNYDYTLTPTLLLHLGVGYQSVDQGVPSVTFSGEKTNYNAVQELGLTGATVNRFFPQPFRTVRNVWRGREKPGLRFRFPQSHAKADLQCESYARKRQPYLQVRGGATHGRLSRAKLRQYQRQLCVQLRANQLTLFERANIKWPDPWVPVR